MGNINSKKSNKDKKNKVERSKTMKPKETSPPKPVTRRASLDNLEKVEINENEVAKLMQSPPKKEQTPPVIEKIAEPKIVLQTANEATEKTLKEAVTIVDQQSEDVKITEHDPEQESIKEPEQIKSSAGDQISVEGLNKDSKVIKEIVTTIPQVDVEPVIEKITEIKEKVVEVTNTVLAEAEKKPIVETVDQPKEDIPPVIEDTKEISEEKPEEPIVEQKIDEPKEEVKLPEEPIIEKVEEEVKPLPEEPTEEEKIPEEAVVEKVEEEKAPEVPVEEKKALEEAVVEKVEEEKAPEEPVVEKIEIEEEKPTSEEMKEETEAEKTEEDKTKSTESEGKQQEASKGKKKRNKKKKNGNQKENGSNGPTEEVIIETSKQIVEDVLNFVDFKKEINSAINTHKNLEMSAIDEFWSEFDKDNIDDSINVGLDRLLKDEQEDGLRQQLKEQIKSIYNSHAQQA